MSPGINESDDRSFPVSYPVTPSVIWLTEGAQKLNEGSFTLKNGTSIHTLTDTRQLLSSMTNTSKLNQADLLLFGVHNDPVNRHRI